MADTTRHAFLSRTHSIRNEDQQSPRTLEHTIRRGLRSTLLGSLGQSIAYARTSGVVRFGAGLGTVNSVLGISTAIVMDCSDLAIFHLPKETYTFFSIQLLDITSSTLTFWLAVLWRSKPEFHRRLVLIATCVLTSAAFARLPYPSVASAYFGADGLIPLEVVRDLIENRKVHLVYWYALPCL